MLVLEQLLPRLRRAPWRRLGVGWAVVFGGLARRGRGRDVDILVDRLAVDRIEAIAVLSEALDVDPGLVDIVELRDAPCPVVLDAYRRGVAVYEAEPGAARRSLLTRVKVCEDWQLALEKLRVVERAVQAARRRWS